MAKPRRAGKVLGSISLMMALISFGVGFAPFTPAMILTVVSIPLAIVSWVLGAFRLGIASLYFGCAAWMPFILPTGGPIRHDYLIAVLGVMGIVISGILFRGYLRTSLDRSE
jgi:hypothetical protein